MARSPSSVSVSLNLGVVVYGVARFCSTEREESTDGAAKVSMQRQFQEVRFRYCFAGLRLLMKEFRLSWNRFIKCLAKLGSVIILDNSY
jgi:hypothetical protein